MTNPHKVLSHFIKDKSKNKKLWEGDKCPKCHEGQMEGVDMKGIDYLQCDQCDYNYR